MDRIATLKDRDDAIREVNEALEEAIGYREQEAKQRRARLIEQYAGIFRAAETFNNISNGEVIAAAIRFADAVIKATEEK